MQALQGHGQTVGLTKNIISNVHSCIQGWLKSKCVYDFEDLSLLLVHQVESTSRGLDRVNYN